MIARYIISFCVAVAGSFNAWAILPGEALFAHEESDTTAINEILYKVKDVADPQQRIADIAMNFVDCPYVAGTLEGEQEKLRVNIGEFDCTTFVETVLALAYTAGEHRTSWRDFIYNLERFRYRGGKIDDYASRLHYFSDWVGDNIHRGNIKDYTTRMPVNDWAVKTIDFMTENRDKYPALSDSLQFAKMKNCEIGYRNHRFPYIKTSRLGSKNFQAVLKSGDVVGLVTKKPGLDVTHQGIIIKKDGVAYLLHASSKKGKVVVDSLPLYDYLKKNGSMGVRIIRLAD